MENQLSFSKKNRLAFGTYEVHSRAARRVWLHEELGGRLAEVLDLVLDGLAHDGVGHGLEVDGALVGQVVEDVRGADGLRSWGRRREVNITKPWIVK